MTFIPSQCNLIGCRFCRRTFYFIHQYSCQKKTKRFTSACVWIVKCKTVLQRMTNVVKNGRSAEGKIIAFELHYQGQITGLIPKYGFPQGLPLCSRRCQGKQLALKYRIRHGRFSNTQILRCGNIHCCSFFNKVRCLQESPHSFHAFATTNPSCIWMWCHDNIHSNAMLSRSATYCAFMHFLTFFFNLPRSQKVIYSFYSS